MAVHTTFAQGPDPTGAVRSQGSWRYGRGDEEPHRMDEDLRRHLGRALDGYFDLRTQALVGRVVTAASIDQLRDDDEVDALFEAFMDLLEERYGRADPGWRPAAQTMLRAELDRQVAEQRALLDLVEDA
jgi:hypothetical protein